MVFAVIFVCCFVLMSHSAFGALDQSDADKTSAKCHDFKAPDSYPMAWRNESLVETRHGIEVVFL